ncbi:MAG: bifunctional (p)ppGpp synthetase/guanosine-3',5'-bis(diphosphate) 3'-pyrophosphohydrolase [Candidatus Aminicenantes bacterium]|nr:bifunctional (p)ppGpp synthetase/guanosine-3',5'-bis(diphosphate) 3'-pyrophosphohydrolase [Candidatus Aminicenantes bacterium]
MIRIDDILDKVSPRLGEKDVLVLQKAYIFAARAHKGQVRRSGEPYLSHPLEVANLLADMGLDRTALVAALLHDALEDTDVTAAELRAAFGKEVAGLVEGVTKIGRVQGAPPEARQAETIRKIILAMTDDLRVIFIKLADRLHNLQTLEHLEAAKRTQIAQETLDIYAPIANRLGMGRIRAELEDLSFRYVAPEDFARVVSLVEPIRKRAERDLKRLEKRLAAILKENAIPGRVEARIKRPYSIYQKMRRQGIEFNQVYDLLALRIITDSVKNCYAALGLIHQAWSHLPHRFRDYVAMPKPNLYQALHTTILTEDGQTYEVQVRTETMHELAESGIAAHWKYKDRGQVDREDKRLLWLRRMVEFYKEQKSPREFLRSLKVDLAPEEIYVFTPKGRVISLPRGATALDFAFKVHSEIGLSAAGCRVNGQLAPLKTRVKTGDIVEIATDPKRSPTRAWLSQVATADARHQIKRYLSVRERSRSAALGKRLWEREAGRLGLPAAFVEEARLLAKVEETSGLRPRSLEDVHVFLGTGKLLARPLLESLRADGGEVRKEGFLRKVVTRVAPRPQRNIVIKDASEPALRLARCCGPIKGEPVIGYLTAGKGISVHAQRCPYVAKDLLDGQRVVDVAWDPGLTRTFRTKLQIGVADEPGVLARVAAAISEAGGNIVRAEVEACAAGRGVMRIELEVRDIEQLEGLAKRVAALKDVGSVERP